MLKGKNFLVFGGLLISALVLILNGCAGLNGRAATPERAKKAVEKRITELAKAKIEGDWAKVYDFFDSGYKAHIKKNQFIKGSKFTFKAFKIEEVIVAQDLETAKAKVKYDTVVTGYNLSGMPENQYWIKEKGKWVLKVNPRQTIID